MPDSPMREQDESPNTPVADGEPARAAGELVPEDYYFDGPYLVFTAAYHLKRGSCCHSGCRHCPYGESLNPEP